MSHLHMGIDVKGFIRNASRKKGGRGWLELGATDGHGRPLTADEVKMEFYKYEALGYRVVPMGDCPTWDYQNGCPGHED